VTFLRRCLAVVALAATSALVLSGCARGGVPAPTASPVPLAAADCKPETTSENTFKVGAILPVGGAAHLGGMAELAALNLAVADINAAGGVTGKPACIVALDSGTGLDPASASAAAATLASQKPSVIMTALTTEATAAVAAAAPGIPVMSLTSTSSALSLSFDTVYRVAPPEWAQALALTQTLIVDGNPKIAIIGSTDPAAVAYRTILTQTFTEEKGLVLYGGLPTNSPGATPTPTPTPVPAPKPSATPAPEQFAPGQISFVTEVTAALATKPNAVVIVASTETVPILAELMKQGWKMPKTYLGDSNVTSYAGVFPAGSLIGAQGTIPGQSPSEELRTRLTAWTTQVKAVTLKSVNYAAEAYDATILAALAGAMYAKTTPSVVAANLNAVSGSYGGDKCDSFAACAKLLNANGLISYRGPSTMGSFTGTHEVSSAMVSIFQYNNENVPIWTGIQSVRSIKEPKK